MATYPKLIRNVVRAATNSSSRPISVRSPRICVPISLPARRRVVRRSCERGSSLPWHIGTPIFLIHAANDYSVASGKALDARLQQLGKPHLLKIYPAIGHTADQGHAFPYLGVSSWEPDVFAFLDEHMRK